MAGNMANNMAGKRYVTMQNDAWDAIAWKLWHEERHLSALIAANPDHTDVLLFPAGVTLNVPATPAPLKQAKELPPWIL